MKVAFVADVHAGQGGENDTVRRGEWAPVFLRRVVHRLNRFIRPDAVVVLGDVADRGESPKASEHYQDVRRVLEALKAPWLVIPGNHDAPVEVFYRHFPQPSNTFDIGKLRIVPFLDEQTEGYHARRSPEDLARSAVCGQGWDGVIMAVQHVPLFPPGTTECPYGYHNVVEALTALRKGGVTIVVSGHYHPGVDLVRRDDMVFLAVPALCEAPFSFWVLEVNPRRAVPTVERHTLQLPDGLSLSESHVHTELAYCHAGMKVEKALEFARLLGLKCVGFAEHSGQLYFTADTYWSGRFLKQGIDSPEGRQVRIGQYFELLAAAGVAPSHTGIEADLDFRGRLVLAPEDRARVGYVIGAVHWIRGISDGPSYDEAAWAAAHREAWSRALRVDMDVLAHPFRIYARRGIRPPADLGVWLARRLAEADVAAELNFHTEEPVPDFVRACLEAGTRLSLGTDSHEIFEVGEFWPHLRCLEGLGVSRRELTARLWTPGESHHDRGRLYRTNRKRRA